MNDDIRRLVRLQELAFGIRDLEAGQRELPERLATLEQAFQQRIAEIGAERLRHQGLVQQQRQLHQERAEVQLKLRQAQQKLMQVHNQREYSAVLNEIDACKGALTTLEDRILDCEADIEELAEPATEADHRIEEERIKVETLKQDSTREAERMHDRLVELTAQRDEVAASLPPEVLRRFESIFRARGGVALARVEKQSCAACHVRLRPQVINLARRGDALVTCDSCRRILYVEESDATDPPAPDGASSAAPPSDGPRTENADPEASRAEASC